MGQVPGLPGLMFNRTLTLLLSLVCLRCEARLVVTLEFQNGKTVLTSAPNDEARAALQAAIQSLEKPYRFALSAEEKKQDDAGQLDDELTRQVRAFTGGWNAFADLFISWTAAVPTRRPADQVLSVLESGLYAPLQALHDSTPLLFEDFPGDGTAVFEIAPPIDSDRIDFDLPGISDPHKRAKRIHELRGWLGELRGSLWFAERLKARLLEFYDRLDLSPSFEFDARTASIRIIESPRIARILFPDDPGARKALYLLLSGREFREHSGHRPPIVFPPGEEPYLSPLKLQTQQLLLAQAGFTVSVEPDITRPPCVDLVIRALPEGKQNQVGGGFQYRPDQGIRVFGLGSRGPVSGQLSVDSALLSPTLSWFADFILFDKLDRRLSIALDDGSQAEPNRFLAGKKVNERRTGGTARVEFEILRGLKLYAESHVACVSLDGERRRFIAADLGAAWFFQNPDWRIRLDSRAGLAYARLSVAANVHREMPRWFAADLRGRYQWAGERAPLFELPSLGGPDSLRGFRRDYAVGHRLWSLQPEIWAPIPLRETWVKRVKLAAFTDVGGVTGAVRYGTGLGLRLLFHPVIVQLDYARGKFYFNVTTTLPI